MIDGNTYHGLMVDELIMPGGLTDEDMKTNHKQWTSYLRRIQNKLKDLDGFFDEDPPLWIACAGIEGGKTEHFKKSFLTEVLPEDFHIPEMHIPLRNTKQTLALANLHENSDIKGVYFTGNCLHRPSQSMIYLMGSLEGWRPKNFL